MCVALVRRVVARLVQWVRSDDPCVSGHRATAADRAKDMAPVRGSYEEWFAAVRRRMGLVGSVTPAELVRCVETYVGFPLLLSHIDAEGTRVYGAVGAFEGQGLIGIRHDLPPRLFLRTLSHELAHILRNHRGVFLRDGMVESAEDREAEAIAAVIEGYLKDRAPLSPAKRFWKVMSGYWQ